MQPVNKQFSTDSAYSVTTATGTSSGTASPEQSSRAVQSVRKTTDDIAIFLVDYSKQLLWRVDLSRDNLLSPADLHAWGHVSRFRKPIIIKI